jgi:hypothetical protein
MYVVTSGGAEEVDRFAVDSVISSGEWWHFEGCRTNQYWFRVTFTPLEPLERPAVEVARFFSHPSSDIRGLAIDTFASVGVREVAYLPCLRWLEANDPIPKLREKAQLAIKTLRSAPPIPKPRGERRNQR